MKRQVHVALPLELAVLCVACDTVSDATGDTCPACAGVGGLMAIARVLNRGFLALQGDLSHSSQSNPVSGEIGAGRAPVDQQELILGDVAYDS